jgi:alpha-ketoglutarate-dependent taurine dioxygenase
VKNFQQSPARCQLTDSIVTRSIVGLKKEESDALLNFLLAHIGRGIDYQARVRWAPKTVVVWDVRRTQIERMKNTMDADELTESCYCA